MNQWESRATQTQAPGHTPDRAGQDTGSEHSLSNPGDTTVTELSYLSGSTPQENARPTTQTQSGNDIPTDPEELRRGFMRQADYTRKTQEAAEIRREAERMQQQAQQQLLTAQQLQAQLTQGLTMQQQAGQRQPDQDVVFATPEILEAASPEAREGLREMDRRMAAALRQQSERLQQSMTSELTKTQNELKARDLLRQQQDYVRANPDIRLTDQQWTDALMEAARNPHYSMDRAVAAANPNALLQRGIELGKQAALNELKQQRDASATATRSQIGAMATFRPGESFSESMAAVYGQQPDANPDTIAEMLRRQG